MLFQALAVILGLVGLPAWLVALTSWRKLFVGLLLFLPVAGVFTLALFPDPIPKLFKDILFLIPLYFGFFVINGGRGVGNAVPQVVLLAIGMFGVIVVLQLLNPSLAAFAVGIIGIKISLSYIPLIFVAAAYAQTPADMQRLFRILTVVALLPCGIGLMQWFLGVAMGYKAAMTLFMGEAAESATQGFVSFQYGGAFMRIPSTFVFVTQYSQFTLVALIPTYITAMTDSSAGWRRLGLIALLVVMAAGILSGARAAIVFVPFVVGLMVVLDGRASTTLAAGLLMPILLFGILMLGGVDPLQVLGVTTKLAESYGDSVATRGLWDALADYPLGIGTGMGSIAARHVVPEGTIQSIENFYAKTVLELGVPGFLAQVGLFLVILVSGVKALRSTRERRLKTMAAALLTYVVTLMMLSAKGWVLDLDPANVFFWVFIGLLMKVPHLRSEGQTAQSTSMVHPFIASLRRPPNVLGRPVNPPPKPGGIAQRR